MALKIDESELVRTACEQIITLHIEARLAQTGTKMVRGSAAGQARFILKKWSLPQMRLFFFLARSKEMVRTREFAEAAGCTPESASRFVAGLRSSKSRRYQVEVRYIDTREGTHWEPLFRQGRELFWSNSGIKLELNTAMLAFSIARQVTNDTRPVYAVTRANHEGAIAAQEADASKDSAERAEARWRTEEEMARNVTPEKRQASLFGGRE